MDTVFSVINYWILYCIFRSWQKFCGILALIGLVLLFILLNVDFSNDGQPMLNTTIVKSTMTITTERHGNSGSPGLLRKLWTSIVSSTASSTASEFIAKSVKSAVCREHSEDFCVYHCSGGSLGGLYKDLEEQQEWCRGTLRVTLEDCDFPSGQMKSSFFNGFYRLESLVIKNCRLMEIEDGAFKVNSTCGIKRLNLNATSVLKLTAETFEGLKSLEEFKLVNLLTSNVKFEGIQFLQPMADTLQEVVIRQNTWSQCKYDPHDWLGGAKKFPRLIHVDLSGNNFADLLNRATFANLVAVQKLILSNCSVTNLEADTFLDIAETLRFLDLSFNMLQIMNPSLVLVKNTKLTLHLKVNPWSCSCGNYELIKALQTHQFSYDEEPRCDLPDKFQSLFFSEVDLKYCKKTITTIKFTITESQGSTDSTTDATIMDGSKVSPATENRSREFLKTDTTESETELPTRPADPSDVTYIALYCQLTNDKIVIRSSDARFTIRPDPPLSVFLLIWSDMKGLKLVYMVVEYTSFHSVAEVNTVSKRTTSPSVTIIYLEGLLENHAYMFCLVPKNSYTISPFNCKSHFVQPTITADQQHGVWLRSRDMPWVISLLVLGLLLVVFLGLITAIYLLRWYPTWSHLTCRRVDRHPVKHCELSGPEYQRSDYYLELL